MDAFIGQFSGSGSSFPVPTQIGGSTNNNSPHVIQSRTQPEDDTFSIASFFVAALVSVKNAIYDNTIGRIQTALFNRIAKDTFVFVDDIKTVSNQPDLVPFPILHDTDTHTDGIPSIQISLAPEVTLSIEKGAPVHIKDNIVGTKKNGIDSEKNVGETGNVGEAEDNISWARKSNRNSGLSSASYADLAEEICDSSSSDSSGNSTANNSVLGSPSILAKSNSVSGNGTLLPSALINKLVDLERENPEDEKLFGKKICGSASKDATPVTIPAPPPDSEELRKETLKLDATPVTVPAPPPDPGPKDTFVSRKSLDPMIRNLNLRIQDAGFLPGSDSYKNIQEYITSILERLKKNSDQTQLTIEDWAYVSYHFEAIVLKAELAQKEADIQFATDYLDKSEECELCRKKYQTLHHQKFNTLNEKDQIIFNNSELVRERTYAVWRADPNFKAAEEKAKHFDLLEKQYASRISIMRDLKDWQHKSRFAWASLAKEKIVPLLKAYLDKKWNPAYARAFSVYGSVGVGFGEFLVGENGASQNLRYEYFSADSWDDENFPGDFTVHSLLSNTRVANVVPGLANNFGELNFTIHSWGKYKEWNDSHDQAVEKFTELVKEFIQCPEIKQYSSRKDTLVKEFTDRESLAINGDASRKDISGHESSLIKNWIFDTEVTKIAEMSETNRTETKEVNQRFNVLKGAIYCSEETKIKVLELNKDVKIADITDEKVKIIKVKQESTGKQAAEIVPKNLASNLSTINSSTSNRSVPASEVQKEINNKIKQIGEENSSNAKATVKDIVVPEASAFGAAVQKRVANLTLNLGFGLHGVLGANASATIKREQTIVKGTHLTTYIKFLLNPLNKKSEQDAVKSLINMRCEPLERTLQKEWSCSEKGAQVDLTEKGVEVLQKAADKKINDEEFKAYLTKEKLDLKLIALRDESLQKELSQKLKDKELDDEGFKKYLKEKNFDLKLATLRTKILQKSDDKKVSNDAFKNYLEENNLDLKLVTLRETRLDLLKSQPALTEKKPEHSFANVKDELLHLRHDFELYTTLQRSLEKQRAEGLTESQKDKDFAEAIRKRWSAKDSEHLLQNMIDFNTHLFTQVQGAPGMGKVKQEIVEFEEKFLMKPKFLEPDIEEKGWRGGIGIKHECDYETFDYEVNMNGICSGLGSGADCTAAIRFRERRHTNGERYYDFLDISLGSGVVGTAALFAQFANVFSEASKLINDPNLANIGEQLLNSSAVASILPAISMGTDFGVTRQYRYVKEADDGPLFNIRGYSHIWTRLIRSGQCSGGLLRGIPVVPGVSVTLGGGGARSQSDLKSEKSEQYTGKSFNNWLLHFTHEFNLKKIRYGDLVDEKAARAIATAQAIDNTDEDAINSAVFLAGINAVANTPLSDHTTGKKVIEVLPNTNWEKIKQLQTEGLKELFNNVELVRDLNRMSRIVSEGVAKKYRLLDKDAKKLYEETIKNYRTNPTDENYQNCVAALEGINNKELMAFGKDVLLYEMTIKNYRTNPTDKNYIDCLAALEGINNQELVAFGKVMLLYERTTQQYRVDASEVNYERCVAAMERLMFVYSPYWKIAKDTSSLRQENVMYIHKKNGSVKEEKISTLEKKIMHKEIRERKNIRPLLEPNKYIPYYPYPTFEDVIHVGYER